jgi:hypothetical protein
METADTVTPSRVTTDGGRDGDDAGENVLVLGPSRGGTTDEYCAERLTSSPGDVSPNALLVTLDETPDRRLETVLQGGAAPPGDVGVVCCDETRSAAAASGQADGPSPGPDPGPGPGFGFGPWIATVPSPGDLTGLGVRIGQALSAWADEDVPVELCFHSLTTLLQYVDERAAFRFCHALTRRVATTGATSHFHLDPDVVDDRAVNTLASLFDRVEDRT